MTVGSVPMPAPVSRDDMRLTLEIGRGFEARLAFLVAALEPARRQTRPRR
jgi:hypothetical protein